MVLSVPHYNPDVIYAKIFACTNTVRITRLETGNNIQLANAEEGMC